MKNVGLTPRSFRGGNRVAEWDGKDAAGSALTSTAGPYVYRITLAKGAVQVSDSATQRLVKGWRFAYVIPEREGFAGAAASGIDTSTVADAGDGGVASPKMVTVVEVTGAPATNIGHYDVAGASATDVQGTADLPAASALVTLKTETGGFFTIYTTPSDHSISYAVSLTTLDGGAVDQAGNEWDADETEDDSGPQKKVRWELTVDASGGFHKKTDGSAGFDETFPP